MNILLREHFGVAPELWATDLATADATRIRTLVRAAAGARLMVSIAGERGAGKTRAVRAAVRALDAVQLIEPLRLDRERLHLGDIQHALIGQLCDERPRRSGEARSAQTRRILGAAAARGPVLLWIDDAHVLHPQTLKGLKRLRELAWKGRAPLLGVVLTGQQDRTAALPEVGLRSDRMTCAGLTAHEAVAAIEAALGPRVGRAQAVALAGDARARNWLDLEALIDACLAEAVARGEGRLTPAALAAVRGATPASAAPSSPSMAPAVASDAAIEALLAGAHPRAKVAA